jgi:hypothetical protein
MGGSLFGSGELVSSPEEVIAFGLVADEGECGVVGGDRSGGAAVAAQEFGAGGGQQVGADQVSVLLEQPVEDAQADGGPVGHGEGDGPG